MTFPIYIPFGPWKVHPHILFEPLGYFLGARLFFILRRRWVDSIASVNRLGTVAGALVGAGIGAKLLHFLDELPLLLNGQVTWLQLLSGKSIVGGLLGGLIGVEIAKYILQEARSTGDLFVLPLCLGIAVGRVGCFLTGLDDHTHGIVTALPWGVDFGDGLRRHPTQIYEIAFLTLVSILTLVRRTRMTKNGDLFRQFMMLYLAFRFGVDFIKPDPRPLLGLSAIQWACVVGLAYYARDLRRLVMPTSQIT